MKFEDFISKFEKRTRTQRGFMLVCPAHDDSPKSPSLSASPSNDGGVLIKCFAGCTAEQIVGSLGLKMKDLFAGERAVAFTPPPVTNGKHTGPTARPVIETVYSYRDANGKEVYQALRMKPKSFRQRHRNPKFGEAPPGLEDDEPEWIWTMDGVERVLYRLPELLPAKTVWIVEGEKDAENLVKLGYAATCNVGGAGKWLDSYSDTLAGKEVIICGDNDEPGRKHVELVFESISESAKTVRIVKLPEAVKDASDYIATFSSDAEARAALDALCGAAHPHFKGHKLPLFTISEMEDDYRRFVRSMGENSFSLGRWLPTLGMNMRALVPGELAFIIGDTGTGKTGILQQIAKAALPLPTIFFELELPKELMFERFATMSSKFTGSEIEKAYQSCDDSLSDQLEAHYKNLMVCPVARLSLQEMENIIMRSELKLGERPRVVLIDYIQLIRGEGISRRERVSDIAEQLKVMAMTTRTIIIVTSQISRPKDVDETWEPSLHSAKESGSIEASCGLMLGAWQDFKEPGTMNIRVLKSTKGGAGVFVKCNFDGARMLITERARIPDEDVPEVRSQHNEP